MLQDWDKRFPGRIETMFQAMQNIVPSHMIDTNLFSFATLSRDTELSERDTAFDKAAVPAVPVGLELDDEQPEHVSASPHSDVQVIALS
jgi:tRNA 2-thiocytidine biosynthesis protein TtcA